MPTIDQLTILYQKGKGSRNLDPVFQTSGSWVWSSELIDRYGRSPTNAPAACVFEFDNGYSSWSYREDSLDGRAFAVSLFLGRCCW